MSSEIDYLTIKEIKKSWIILRNKCIKKIEQSYNNFGLDTCLSIHFLGIKSEKEETFRLKINSFISSYQFTESNLSLLGMLSYFRWIDSEQNKELFENGLLKLMSKKPSTGGVGFVSHIRLVVGVVFGYIGFGLKNHDQFKWLNNIMETYIKNVNKNTRDALLAAYLYDILNEQTKVEDILVKSKLIDGRDQVVALWMAINIINSSKIMSLKEGLVNNLYKITPSGFDTVDCAMTCNIIDNLLGNASNLLTEKGLDYLINLVKTFRYCIKRENNLQNEKDVQRVLWTMLRANYDDVVDEEYLKRYGLKNYKLDFGIKHLRTIVEVKYVGTKTNPKKIQDEMLADSQGYLNSSDEFDKIIFFIYDGSPKFNVYNDSQFVKDLKRVAGVKEVIVEPGRAT